MPGLPRLSGLTAPNDDDYRERLPALGDTIKKTAQNICALKTLKRRIPISLWLPKYKRSYLLRDVVAGFTVGLTAIPQNIGYALVAGLPPQYGLYSAFMGSFMYIFFGSCKAVTLGFTAIMAILTMPHVREGNADFAVLLTFLMGSITFLLGFFNLGFLVQFIPSSVISGFTTAAALTIASAQIKNLFGLPGQGTEFVQAWENFFRNAKNARLGDSLLGVGSVLALFALKKIGTRRGSFAVVFKYIGLGRNALVDIFGAVLAYFFFINGSEPFKLTGNIASGFPAFRFPPFSTTVGNETFGFLDMVRDLGMTPISISLIAVLDAVTLATIFCEKGKTVNATQEMIANGVCNIMGSFVSSMPITSSFTRSALNNACGVRSPLGGIVTGTMVLLALGTLTPYFYYLPKATLAAVVISAMFATMEWREIYEVWKTRRIDVVPMIATILSGVFIGLDTGILVGAAVNLFISLYTNSRPNVGTCLLRVAESEAVVVCPNRDIVFSSADYFRYRLTKTLMQHPTAQYVIIDGKFIQACDFTAAKKFVNLIESLQLDNKIVRLWNWPRESRNVLLRYDPTMRELIIAAVEIDDLLIQLKFLHQVQAISISSPSSPQ